MPYFPRSCCKHTRAKRVCHSNSRANHSDSSLYAQIRSIVNGRRANLNDAGPDLPSSSDSLKRVC